MMFGYKQFEAAERAFNVPPQGLFIYQSDPTMNMFLYDSTKVAFSTERGNKGAGVLLQQGRLWI